MNFFLKNIFVILIIAVLSGCSDNSEVNQSQSLPKKYKELIQQSDQINEALRDGRILALSSDRDRTGFATTLKEARNALILLARNPRDRLGVQLGHRAIKERSKYIVGRGDVQVVDEFYEKLGAIVSESAELIGLDLGELDWRLYGYRFSSGIAPFGVFASASNWRTGVSLDESYVSVRGPDNKAWLISPSFDLREIKNPSFRITHQTRVDQNDRTGDDFNRTLINNEAFKAYVSTDYSDGDPEDANWVEVNLGEMPASVDFHTVQSPKIDLSEFKSKKTVVALVLNANPSIIGSHYLTWSLSNFELFGAGELKNVLPRLGSLHRHQFDKNTIEPFQQMKTAPEIADWEPFGFGGRIQFVKIEGNGATGENWLFSPRYPLRGIQKLNLNIKEVIRRPNFEKMQILISADYDGGDPENSNWELIDRKDYDPSDFDDWQTISTGPTNLKDYLGKEVVLAFRYISTPDHTSGWEIETINFVGDGEEIAPKKLELTYRPPNMPPALDFETLKDFDFNKGDLGFSQESVTGDPAKFEISSRNGAQYFLISGHQEKKVGRQRLISTPIQLTSHNYVQINQAINFYPQDAKEQKLIRIFVTNGQTEQELQFKRIPLGSDWNVLESEELMIPKDYWGQEVQFIFEYGSIDDVYPNWNIHQFKVLEAQEVESL